MFPRHKYLCMGDSKLDTPENLAAAQSTAGEFLCAGAFTQPLQARFREVREQLKPVAYCSKSDAKRPPEQRDQYQACEVRDKVVGAFDGHPRNTDRYLIPGSIEYLSVSVNAQRSPASSSFVRGAVCWS